MLCALPNDMLLHISRKLARTIDRVRLASVNKYMREKRYHLMGDIPLGFTCWSAYIDWLVVRRTEAIVPVAAGDFSSPRMVVTEDGKLMSFRFGDIRDRGVSYTQIMEGTCIRGISRNEFADFNIVVSMEGNVYTWGKCYPLNFGQCGHGGVTDCPFPMQVCALAMHRIRSVSASQTHILALTETGEVFAWGRNRRWQCGFPSNNCIYIDYGVEGDVVQYIPRRAEIADTVRVRDVSAGDECSVVVTEEGRMYTFGNTIAPRIVNFHTDMAIKSAVVSRNTEWLALTESGSVIASSSSGVPRAVVFPGEAVIRRVYMDQNSRSAAVATDGKLFMWEKRWQGQAPTRIDCLDGMDVIAISLTQQHAVGVTRDGTVFDWQSWEFPHPNVPIRLSDRNCPTAMTASSAAVASLEAAVAVCATQPVVAGFSSEEAVAGLRAADELRALFLALVRTPCGGTTSVEPPAEHEDASVDKSRITLAEVVVLTAAVNSATALAVLKVAAADCFAAQAGFSSVGAAVGLRASDELRTIFLQLPRAVQVGGGQSNNVPARSLPFEYMLNHAGQDPVRITRALLCLCELTAALAYEERERELELTAPLAYGARQRKLAAALRRRPPGAVVECMDHARDVVWPELIPTVKSRRQARRDAVVYAVT